MEGAKGFFFGKNIQLAQFLALAEIRTRKWKLNSRSRVGTNPQF
jgi:hypothetical protein